MQNEFSRTALLLGSDAVGRLKKSCVLVLGVGGVGSHCIEALTRSGVGRLILVDNDTVSITNINRQSIAYHSTIGQYKTQVMKKRILDINPEADVVTREEFVLADRIDALFSYNPDFIVDAIDTVTAKLALARAAEEKEIPIISSMGTGNKLNPSAFEIADIYQTSVCPLCKVMRRELKKRGVKKLTVLYSREEPRKPLISSDSGQASGEKKSGAEGGIETKGTAGRPVPGSVSFVPPVAGLLIAGHVIKELAGVTDRR